MYITIKQIMPADNYWLKTVLEPKHWHGIGNSICYEKIICFVVISNNQGSDNFISPFVSNNIGILFGGKGIGDFMIGNNQSVIYSIEDPRIKQRKESYWIEYNSEYLNANQKKEYEESKSAFL